MNERTELINKFIEVKKYRTYLEIGAGQRDNFDQIILQNLYKVCVDPDPTTNATFKMSSDEYFKQLNHDVKFDIIFIDGLHESNQVDNDIHNSLNHLNTNGVVLCHDCLPEYEMVQKYPRESMEDAWYGDVWKSIFRLRIFRADVKVYTVQLCTGIAIITKTLKTQPTLSIDEDLTWNYYLQNRNKFMNIITKEQIYEYLTHHENHNSNIR